MMAGMRTTITLDPDVAALVRRVMAERGIGLKAAVNTGLRAGLQRSPASPGRTPTFSMGEGPSGSLDRALQLAGAMEDEELVRRLAART